MEVRLSDIVAPAFRELYADVVNGRFTAYKLSGGRGSCKSTFVSVMIVLCMMMDALEGVISYAVVFRRYKDNLHGSVYEQMVWAIEKLGVAHLWKQTVSPLKLVYTPTQQAILFRGADNVTKAKSIKVPRGYIKYLWFEELDEFEGANKVRSIHQSVARGGDKHAIFYSYNPPKNQRSWVNDPVQLDLPNTACHHSDFLSVPPDWLGPVFIQTAEHLKRINPDAYKHEYLGEVTGTGAEVFTNLKATPITDAEIADFDNLRRGVDWGYSSDPFHFSLGHYDKTRRKLYIFAEVHQTRLSNRKAADRVRGVNIGRGAICADSAEPKSIADFNDCGLVTKRVKKGPDSVEYGIKWMSEELEQIIIDPVRCPNTWREFYGYALDIDHNGNLVARYPDRDNHSIDAVRYSLVEDMKKPAIRVWK